jgi:hypothetical protein
MKKILTRILLCVMALVMALGMVGCNEGSWEGTTMKNWGAKISGNGFITETANYIYFINGADTYGGDNTFGAPVKATLMAADKSTIGTDNVKTQIVVPKLFVASDYKAGVFIYGNYVYYGTPSTNRNNSGNVASDELTFMRTKLDGTESKTFFTVESNSVEYRFIKGENGKIFLVYYDSEDYALKCYDIASGSSTVIAKTDDKTAGKFESLDKYYFLEGEGTDDLLLVYTAKVYLEDYFEDAASKEGYERTAETYNKVYAYKVGDAKEQDNEFRGKCILNGKADDLTFEIEKVNENYIFYKQTNLDAEEKHFAIENSTISTASIVPQEIKNAQYLSGEIIIKSLSEVYVAVFSADTTDGSGNTVASAENYIVKTALVGDVANNWTRLGKIVKNSKLFDVVSHGADTYVYYFNGMSELVRIKIDLDNKDLANEEKVSDYTVASAWYKPEFLNITKTEGEGAMQTEVNRTFLFYLDNSSFGGSYVKYVKVYDSKDPVEVKKETNEETEKDSYYLEGQTFIGKMSNQDMADLAAVKLGDIPSVMDWDREEGKIVGEEEVIKARKAYNDLSPAAKELYGETNLKKLQSAEKAVKAMKVLCKLDGIENYDMCSEQEKQEYKDAYKAAKTVMNTISQTEDTQILNYIEIQLVTSHTQPCWIVEYAICLIT